MKPEEFIADLIQLKMSLTRPFGDVKYIEPSPNICSNPKH